jgi:hypothetical protein
MATGMNLPKPRQWEALAIVPTAAGLYWLLAGYGGGWLFWGLVPGILMLSTGVSLLLMAGDARITHFMAAGGLIGFVLVLPVMLFGGFGDAVMAGLLAAGSYLTAGYLAISREPLADGAPAPDKTLALYAKAALDEALLAYFVGFANFPGADAIERIGRDAARLEALIESRGWTAHPETLHPAPPAPDRVYVQQARIYGREYERLSYPSGFVADAALPGAEDWGKLHNNHQSTAWVLRHPGPPRPWLMCVHGYRMGEAWLDFTLFPPRWLHDHLGLNLFMPVLPLHGPRRVGLRSGDQYLDGDPLDLLHAQTQALWDLRRALAWIRTQEDAPRIGVMGYSLGGYNTALLAQYERGLDFAIAGIPVVDYASALWRHIPAQFREYFAAHGLDLPCYRRLLQPVSPLARPPLLERDQLYIFAGSADRVVLPEQPLKLAAHWGVPIQWYQGGHLSFRGERLVTAHIEAAMQRANWPVSADLPPSQART